MTTIQVIRDDEKATAILKAIRQIDEGAELAQVVHRRWIRYRCLMITEHICSACKEFYMDAYNYCPNCGAKMDGGQEKWQMKNG